ncbi:MAG: 7-carboxy-7-deazaguanine synthase QueE [Verrucomicrobiota bacterium]|nr:7-carboxy-7-deazaguanine synthase QueE [Verrucomicrobiota bacterium]
MLAVTEFFSSIQGEGPFAGTPAFFLRLAGCPDPKCPWCDTKYAWELPTAKTSISKIISEIKKTNLSTIVITGGEPFIQWDEGLRELNERLLAINLSVHYETSGKVTIPVELKKKDDILIICSPKYLNNKWLFPEENAYIPDFFKFVFMKNETAIKRFVKKYTIENENIYLMPEGAERESQITNMSKVWNICIKNNWKFSPRLHIIAFNRKKRI